MTNFVRPFLMFFWSYFSATINWFSNVWIFYVKFTGTATFLWRDILKNFIFSCEQTFCRMSFWYFFNAKLNGGLILYLFYVITIKTFIEFVVVFKSDNFFFSFLTTFLGIIVDLNAGHFFNVKLYVEQDGVASFWIGCLHFRFIVDYFKKYTIFHV